MSEDWEARALAAEARLAAVETLCAARIARGYGFIDIDAINRSIAEAQP